MPARTGPHLNKRWMSDRVSFSGHLKDGFSTVRQMSREEERNREDESWEVNGCTPHKISGTELRLINANKRTVDDMPTDTGLGYK